MRVAGWVVAVGLGSSCAATVAAEPQAPASRTVEIVSVTGCLRERGPDHWLVVAATDPVPSLANAATAKELPTSPPDGPHAFALIGTTEFGLPSRRDHTVVARGLLIKASPVHRINLTSIVDALPACAAGAPK